MHPLKRKAYFKDVLRKVTLTTGGGDYKIKRIETISLTVVKKKEKKKKKRVLLLVYQLWQKWLLPRTGHP